MTLESDPRLVKRLAVFASASAVFSMMVGFSGLLGWWLHIESLKTWGYGPVTMKANTSACFLLLGLSLWLERKPRPEAEPSTAKFAARLAASLVCLVGALSAFEYIFDWHLAIDEFLALEFPRDPSSGTHPGLMSPVTGTVFLLLGLALVVLDLGKKHWSWPAQLLCLGAMGGSLLGLSTVFVMPGVNKLSLALPTSVTFPLLCAGIVCARSEWVLGGLAAGASTSARLFRRAVPVAVLALCAIGWTISTPLLTTTHLSWVEAALLGLLCCGLLIGFIVWMAFVVERSHSEQRFEVRSQPDTSIAVTDARVHDRVEIRLRRNATAGFTLAVLLTGALGVLSVTNGQKAARDETWVAQTHEVIAVLASALQHLDDVETGTRGFLLTGEKPFLEPYEKGQRSVTEDLAQLRRLTADDPSQRKRLDRLEEQADRRIALASVLIAERQAGNMPTTRELEEGKQVMDAARATVSEMDQEEKRLLQERAQRSDATRQLSNFVISLGSLLGVIFLATAGVSVGSLIAMNARARAETLALNADLERRVARRTADLSESEGRLAGVIQSAMDAIIAQDEQGRIAVFNHAAEKMFRCPAEEVIGKTVDGFIPQRFRAEHSEHIRRFTESGISTRKMGRLDVLWGQRADGEEFPMEASISRTKAGGKNLFTVIIRDVSERLRAETSRLRLAAIVESTDSAILSKSLDGIVTSWNKGAEILYGYTEKEMVGKHVSQIIPAELKGEEREFLRQVAQGRLVRRDETLRRRKDGNLIYVSLIISPVRDTNGAIIGASTIAHDITASKHRELVLREQSQLLDLAQVFVRDMDSRIVMWSRGSENLYGFSSGEAVGRVSHDLLQTRFPMPLKEIENALLRNDRWEGELTHRKKDGSTVAVKSTWVLHRDAKGIPQQILEMNSDITARKRAEQMLAASEERMGIFIEHAPAALAMFDCDMRYLFVSRRWLTDYGREGLDLRGKSHYEVFPEVSEHWKEMHRRGLAGEVLSADRDRFDRADGTVQWIKWEIHPWRDAKDEVGGIVIFAEDITERKLAEDRLRVSEERLQLFIEHVPAPVAMFDREMRYICASRWWQRDRGLGDREISGLSHYELLQIPEKWKEAHHRALAGEVVREEDDTLEHSDGSVHAIRWEARPWYEEPGKIGGIVILMQDVTERKRAEDALRESEGRLRALVLATSDVIYRMSPDWNEMHQLDGRGFIADTKAPIKDWLGVYIPPDDQPLVVQTIQNAIRNKSVFELEHRVRQADGSVGWTLSRAIPRLDANGEIVEWFGAASNVTPRKLAEESLRESHARLKRVLEVETVGVMFWDLTTGALTDANNTFLDLMGYARADMEAGEITWQKLTPPEFLEASREELRKFAVTGRVGPYEKEYLHKDGARQWFAFAGSSLGNNTCVEFCVDISERKKVEQALARKVDELARSNAELEQFAYVASHDLQEPLRMVANYTQLFAQRYKGKLDEQAEKYIHYSVDGATRMQAMIQDLLAFSRVGRTENGFHEIDLNLAVKLALENLQPVIKESGAIVNCGRLPIVRVHRTQIVQVFQNLIGNAIKFRGKSVPVINISAEQKDGEWIFSVADNGIGIAAEHSRIIFAIFQRLHTRSEYPGNGIGLSICKKIVERHGGRIWVESKEGQGSTFRFTLAQTGRAETARKEMGAAV